MEKENGIPAPLILNLYKTGEPVPIIPEEIVYITPGLFECTVVLIDGKSYRVKQTYEDVRDLIRKRK